MPKPDEVDARILNDKLKWAEREGAFLILAVPEPLLEAAEAKLLASFNLERRDLNEVFLRAMQEQAVKAKADWNVVLEAHNAEPGSRDARNLAILVGLSIPEIERQLSTSEKTLLLINAGVLTRYGRIDLLERLRDRVWSTSHKLHGVWTLMKVDDPGSPSPPGGMGAIAPFKNQLAHVPEIWVTGH